MHTTLKTQVERKQRANSIIQYTDVTNIQSIKASYIWSIYLNADFSSFWRSYFNIFNGQRFLFLPSYSCFTLNNLKYGTKPYISPSVTIFGKYGKATANEYKFHNRIAELITFQ